MRIAEYKTFTTYLSHKKALPYDNALYFNFLRRYFCLAVFTRKP